jgi:hypothetical protein
MNKLREFFTTINVFRLLVAGTALVISIYGIVNIGNIASATNTRLFSITQVLLIVLFVVNGIEGVKAVDKTKRYLACFDFLVAFVMLFINIRIFFNV